MSSRLNRGLAALEERHRILSGPVQKLDLKGRLHQKQYAFAADPARFKVARCSRRAGKTKVCPEMLVCSALDKPGSVSIYGTKTLRRAKQLMWSPLLQLNVELGLGGIPNGQDASILLPNGSRIQLAGANTRDEIEKWRGDAYGIAILDEAQTLPLYIQELVDDIIGPALMDYSGTLCLIGTPPPVPAGYFNDICVNKEWKLFEWTAWENPFLEQKSGKTVRQLLDEDLRRRGLTESDASIQREWFGRVAVDLNSLVLRYEATRNDYDELPEGKWEHVIGVDLGFDDADAIVVLSWLPNSDVLYLTEEHVIPKQTLTPLGQLLQEMYWRLAPLGIAMDQGGLGKKIAEELKKRPWALPVTAAEKTRKLEHIEFVNDALRTGKLRAKKGTRFAQDCALLEWDKANREKWKISERYHSDAVDAVLYAWRFALNWLHEPKKPTPVVGTPEYYAAEEARMMEDAIQDVQRKQRDGELPPASYNPAVWH